MKFTRRSLFGMLAGLPLVGKMLPMADGGIVPPGMPALVHAGEAVLPSCLTREQVEAAYRSEYPVVPSTLTVSLPPDAIGCSIYAVPASGNWQLVGYTPKEA